MVRWIRSKLIDLQNKSYQTTLVFRGVKNGAALMLLCAILVLTILPEFDLDPAHLRASANSLPFVAKIAAVIQSRFHVGLRAKAIAARATYNAGPDLLDLTCVRLC